MYAKKREVVHYRLTSISTNKTTKQQQVQGISTGMHSKALPKYCMRSIEKAVPHAVIQIFSHSRQSPHGMYAFVFLSGI